MRESFPKKNTFQEIGEFCHFLNGLMNIGHKLKVNFRRKVCNLFNQTYKVISDYIKSYTPRLNATYMCADTIVGKYYSNDRIQR